MQQELRLFAQHEPERKRRRWKHRRTMQYPTDFIGDIPLAPDIRCHRVDRAAHTRILERQPIDPDDVVDVNPGKPLPAVAQRTADEEPKWQGQQSKGERLATRTPSGSAFCASASHCWLSRARNESPGSLSSMMASSPRSP